MHLAAELSDREQRLERTTRECKAHKNTLEDMERSRKLERQAQSSAHTAEKNELKEQTLERTHQMQQQHTEALSKHQRESKLRVRVVTTLVGTRFRQTEFRVLIVVVALLWRATPSSCTLYMCTSIQFLILSGFIPRLKKLSLFFFHNEIQHQKLSSRIEELQAQLQMAQKAAFESQLEKEQLHTQVQTARKVRND